jgi:hypothetical protein
METQKNFTNPTNEEQTEVVAVDPASVGAIIGAIASLLATAGGLSAQLAKLVKALPLERTCAIGIKNFTDHELIHPSFYTYSGKIVAYNHRGEPKHDVGIAAEKSSGAAVGTVAVASYQIKNTNKRIALMWSVPFDWNLYSSWFKGAIIKADQDTNYDLYEDMYYNYHNITSGDCNQSGKYGSWQGKDNEFKVSGNMTDGSNAEMTMELHKIS